MTGKHTTTGRTKRMILLVLILFLANLILPGAAEAAQDTGRNPVVDPVGHNESYTAVLYNNRNGLPTSEANDIVQTEEGFLWIGCYSGLIRYDGNSFERMDSTTGIGSVTCLYADSHNRLWIGTNDSGLALMEGGEFRRWNVNDGLGSSKICCIEEDGDGRVYVGTTAGVAVITPDFALQPVNDEKIVNAYIDHMGMGKDGLLYCYTENGNIFTLRDGKLEDYTDYSEAVIKGICTIYPDPETPGMLYVGTEGSEVYHIFYKDLKDASVRMDKVNIEPLTAVYNIRKFGDQIWICARNGIGMLDGSGVHPVFKLPMNNMISHVITDYEGNLWFTSTRQGVMKLVPNRFMDLFERVGLPECVVNSTCMFQEKLFVGTDTGLLVIDEDSLCTVPLSAAKTASGEELEPKELVMFLGGCRIRSILRDSKNRLWISTWRGDGLLRYDGDEMVAFTAADGLHSNHIRAVSDLGDGSIAVACTGGVNVIEGDRVTASYGEEEGIINPEILTVCTAPNGDILAGSNGGGIYVLGSEGTRCIDTGDGLSSGIVMRIKYDPENRLFWIVTSNSIAYMTEDYRATTVRRFPYSNNFDLYRNSKGDMWILSSNGIYVVPDEELIANGEIRAVHYGMGNGLMHLATSNSYSELTEEGDLYIAGSTGVSRINIERSLEDISDIKAAVPYIEADGVRIDPDESGGFTVPARTRKLTVYDYVFNYSLTDPQVSYRLEGFDTENVTVRRRDLDPVTYTNLKGGTYYFVMELKDAMGRGSRTLSVPIVKEKALYEHVLFYVLLAQLALLMIIGAVHLYLKAQTRKMEIRHQEEMEKERLNTELQTGGKIQESMLPHQFPPFPERGEFDIYASMDPAREVGGDFYDFFLIDEDHLCIVIADVSGKGIPAALFMMVSMVVLQNNALMGKSAAEILTTTNEAICANNMEDMFVTVWLGILEISTGKLTAANAGHEYPTLTEDGKFTLLKDRHGFVIGGMEGARYREYELSLQPGDKLFLYTDGVPEANDPENRMFGTDRMLEALNSDPKAPPKQILKNVRAAVDEFVKDAEQFDDLTMLCIEYHGTDGQS